MNEAETSGHISAETVPSDQDAKRWRFEEAVSYLITITHDGGLHSSEMIPTLRYWHEWAKSHP